MFNGATNLVVQGGSFVANVGSPPRSLDKLIAEVAPNAILNAGGRADEVRCFLGTREEVIAKLEKFMDDDSPDKKRVLWLSGPAGAGKSAIFQTVAERCNDRGRQAANFFFFRGDSTRSNSRPLVATLVYQLRLHYPALDEPLAECLEKNPLICRTSLATQFNQLISSPLQSIRKSTPIQQEIVLIVDGLDECNDKRDQDQILVALHTLAHADHSPFLILVASRAEPQLVMSFNRLGSSVGSIFLNDDYQPQRDIRLFVVAKFIEIKKDHHLAATLSTKWPTDEDIDAITDKSSGQFIYAATVMRCLQFMSSNPSLTLVTILEIPPSTDHNPLAHLDAVYSYIFSKVQSIRVVKLILFARNCAKRWRGTDLEQATKFRRMLRLVRYKDIEVQSYFADLAAVIKVLPESKYSLLQFYHASLEDYFNNKSRSSIYFVNENEIAAELTCMCLRNLHDAESLRLTVSPLSWVQKPTPELFESLLDASKKRLKGSSEGQETHFFRNLIGDIERLYWEHDHTQFTTLLQCWSRFGYINNIYARIDVQPQNPLASQDFKKYWMTEEYTQKLEEPLVSPADSIPAGAVSRSVRPTSARASPSAAIGGSDSSLSIPKHGAGRRKGRHRQSRSTSAVSSEDEEDGRESEEDDRGPYKLRMIRVKFHYQGSIRGMTLTPETPFSVFVNKVTSKFGKKFNDFTLTFKDEDGADITLCDDSDYELAIETVRESSRGMAQGKLEIWCQDSSAQ